jgi:hypothetical protein
VPDAIFEPLGGDRYLPTRHAVGPWDPAALHGGPAAALVAGRLEAAVSAADLGVEFLPARVTVELLRPVPVAPLTVTTTIRRPGRRVCTADAEVTDGGGTVVLAATLGVIRRRPFEHGVAPTDPVPPGPETGEGLADETLEGPDAFHRTGVEHRMVRGTRFEEPGPATDWIRLRHPLVEGRDPTPLERVLAAADFGNGISKLFDFEQAIFVNPDLTVSLHRLPVGEWICLDAVTRIGDEGVGFAESLLFDARGPVGRATQSLLVEPR